MAETELDDGIQKLQSFIAQMESVTQRLLEADVAAVSTALAAAGMATTLLAALGAEMEDLASGDVGAGAEDARAGFHTAAHAVQQGYEAASRDGLLTRFEERQIAQKEREHDLAEQQVNASDVDVKEWEGHVGEAREAHRAALDELHAELDEAAAAFLEQLDTLHEASEHGEEQIVEHGGTLAAAFEALHAAVEAAVSDAHQRGEAVGDLCGSLAEREDEAHSTLGSQLDATTGAVQAMESTSEELLLALAGVVTVAAQEGSSRAAAAAMAAAESAAESVVQLFLDGVEAPLASIASAGAAVAAAAEQAASAGSTLATLLAQGGATAERLNPFLPQVDPIREVVSRVNDLLDALNPFD